MLSSPRAESARGATTGRRCPHSVVGEDFGARGPGSFTKTAVTRKLKVEKSIPRCEMNCLFKDYKQAMAIDKIRDCMTNQVFGPKKYIYFLVQTMFWPRPKFLVMFCKKQNIALTMPLIAHHQPSAIGLLLKR